MLSKSDISLKNLKTGEERTFLVRHMTLRDKCTLDEWIRRRYVSEALKECNARLNDANERKLIFATANEMDFLSNSWAVTDQRWLARFVWQCLENVQMDFETFFTVYMNQELGNKEEEERYQKNWLALKESRGFVAGENPTVPEPTSEKKEDGSTTTSDSQP